MTGDVEPCPCGVLADDGVCDYVAWGYPWCRACQEHHRPWPACPGITQTGEPADGEVRLEQILDGDRPSPRCQDISHAGERFTRERLTVWEEVDLGPELRDRLGEALADLADLGYFPPPK